MIKQFLAIALAFATTLAVAAVDVNKADQAALESVRGIGPSLSTKIMTERNKSAFKDWGDLIDRVVGVGTGNAGRFSAEGLTVNGDAFKGMPVASAKSGMDHAKTKAK